MIQSTFKKIIIIFVAVVLISFLCWYLMFYVCNKKNDFTEKQITKLIPLIDEFHKKNHKYPAKLEEINQFVKQRDDKVLLFFSGINIKYEVISNGYRLYYHQAPLGPFNGYDSSKQDWFYEE